MEGTDLLYKYLPWKENTINYIKDSTLYFNIPKNFNDPFDTRPCFDINEESRKELLDCFEKDNIQRFAKDIINEARKFSCEELIKIAKDVAIDKFNNHGVTCFSRKKDNILMWSHYANDHKGICLGFDIDENDEHLKKFLNKTKNREILPNVNACLISPVKYVSNNKRPIFDVLKIIHRQRCRQ